MGEASSINKSNSDLSSAMRAAAAAEAAKAGNAAGRAVQTYQARPAQPSQLSNEQIDTVMQGLEQKHPGWTISREDLTFTARRESDGVTVEQTAKSASPSDIDSAITSPVMSLRRSIEIEDNKLRERSTPRPPIREQEVGATTSEEQKIESLYESAMGTIGTLEPTSAKDKIVTTLSLLKTGALTDEQVGALIKKNYITTKEIGQSRGRIISWISAADQQRLMDCSKLF